VGGVVPSQDALGVQSVPGKGAVAAREHLQAGTPRSRTLELVAAELMLVRDELDRHVGHGRLRLAGECSVELEQLRAEFGRLKGPKDLPDLVDSR
jgi:hypothetical protein